MNHRLLRTVTAIVLILLIGRFFLMGWHYMSLNSNSQDNDQGGYLYMGVAIRDSGMLSDGIRGPLFPAVISPLASYNWDFFTSSKYLCVALGILAVLLIYLVGRRLYDPPTALAAAVLFGVNINFIQFSAFVLPESLLVILFFLAWVNMSLAIRRDRSIYWALAGLFAALATHTKGTGQLMMVTFIAAAVLLRGLRVWKSRNLWLLVAAYLVAASPLYVYNAIHFGSPTFNWAITHQMWMDEWRDWYNVSHEQLPTMASYLRAHSPGSILARELGGMLQLRFVLAKALYPARDLGFDRFLLSPWSGAALALLAALLGLFRRPVLAALRKHREETLLAALMFAVFYALFAWYMQIVSSAVRFMLPLVPLILLIGCNLLVAIAASIWERLRSAPLRGAAVTAGLVLVVLALQWAPVTAWQRRDAFSRNIFALDAEFNASGDYPLAWLGDVTPPGTAVAKTSVNVKPIPLWRHSDHFRFAPVRDGMTLPDLERFFDDEGVQFIIIQDRMARRESADLDRYFRRTEDQVEVLGTPPGWALNLAYPALPCRWCVFRLMDRAPLAQSVEYRFEDAFRLTGYELSDTTLRPGGRLIVQLEWQFPDPTRSDLTVFTQLQGPDGRLYGQKDNPPLQGAVRTSSLPPGSRLIDRYDLTVASDAPPGDYRLLVGVYDPATGERRAVSAEAGPLPDRAIPLAALTLPAW